MLKHIIDFSVALIGVLLFLPFFPFIWLIIKLSTHAPVFIREDRVGKENKLIRLYRFNVSNGDSGAAHRPNKTNNRLGRFLRFLKLDGWPLLINVLKGELSLIGPRPEKPEFVMCYTEEQKKVLTVRPGIWGPYYYFGDNGKDDSIPDQINGEEYYRKHILPEKLKVELYYVLNRSIGKDIKVLINLLENRITYFINDQLMKEAKIRNFFLPLDLFFISFSYFLSYQLRFDWNVPKYEYSIFLKCLPIVIIFRIVTFYYLGIYKNLLKYLGIRDLISLISACTISSFLIVTAIFLLGILDHSRSIFLIDWLLCIPLIGGSRLIIRVFSENARVENKIRKNALIVGASDVGEMLLRELDKTGRDKYNVVGFVDDNLLMHGRTIHGVRVLGAFEDIPQIVPRLRVDEVLITVSQISSEEMKSIVNYCKQTGVRRRMVPAVCDLLSGSVHLSRFREVEISDLFGRQPVELDLSAIQNFIQGKKVLVTGAGGSIGSELCRQISEYHPARLILVDKNENYLHEIRCELNTSFESIPTICSLSDITNRRKQHLLFERYRPEIVFHAAAQKHVPLSEENPEEAIHNNVLGTKVIADLANEFGVGYFVFVSSDKAVNPTSIMGVTKRIAELYIQAFSNKNCTKFVTVRFGNVLNSNGSVVPIFMKQIERGGPVTVTHPDVERYFMSISEAVQLILQAVTMGKRGEIFVLNMGKSIRIVDLAIELINQAGFKPFEDIPIKFIGLRPGEKLFEELIGHNEEPIPTSHPSINTLKLNQVSSLTQIEKQLEKLSISCFQERADILMEKLQKIVPEYNPSNQHSVPSGRKGEQSQDELEKFPLDYEKNLALSV